MAAKTKSLSFTEEELGSILEYPNILKRILRGYTGAFSIGIADDGLILKVEDEKPKGFPRYVVVNHRRIPITVQGGFRKPKHHFLAELARFYAP